jgi:hypothetical protein
MERYIIKFSNSFLFLFVFTNFLNGSTGLLYNTSTHETITPDQIAGGGTEWMLLDANNSNYASYTHPAYYNTGVHQVLDSANGSKVGDWILTTSSSGSNSGDTGSSADSKILYNTSTHETITPDQIAGGGTEWMLLDANNSNYASYTHPAYYNTSVHQVLDSANGSKVGDWVLEDSEDITFLFLEKVQNPNPEQWANFGLKLSITDNFLSTGARYADISDNGNQIYDAGKVYVFKVDEFNGTSSLVTDIPSKSAIAGIGYGYTLSADAEKLVVAYRPNSSVFRDTNGSYVDTNTPARVEIYDLDENGSAIFNQTILAVDNLTTRDSFGRNLHLHNDILTIPGIDYTSYDSSKGNATSRIYRYKLEANKTATLLQTITLREGMIDHFGEINFSQYGNRFVIGDASDTNGSEIEGKVSIYSIGEDGKLIFNQSILSPATMIPIQDQKSNGFGRTVVQLGNLLVVGAYNESFNGRYVGSVYIYKFDPNGFVQPIGKILPYDFTNDEDLNDSVNLRFGRAIEVKEKPDGTASIFISAYHDGAGSLYEFRLDKDGGAQFINKVRPPDGEDGDRFGISIESSENFLHVGAYENGDNDLNESGAFYSYRIANVSGNKKKSIYNTVTQELVSGELASKPNSSPWSLLDSSKYPDYTHPAYYNSNLHQVLDSSIGSSVDGWVLTNFVSGLTSSFVEIKQVEENSSTLVLYNVDTKKVITPSEVATGSTDWLLLSPEKYPEKYSHPAYYNLTFHAVVENVDGNVEQGWTLRDSSLIDENSSNPDLYKVLYNTSSHQVITRDQIESGGTDWMALASGFVGNDGSTYAFPAYYNKQSHGVLDNTPGDSESGWILTHMHFEVKVTSTDGGKVTGEGNYSKGAMVNLIAEPSLGFRFVGWNGHISSSEKSVELEVLSSFTVNASFTKDNWDDDSDGLSNYEEKVIYGTSSDIADSDQDGIDDKQEIENGMNPISSDKAMIDKISQILNSVSYGTTPYTNRWFFDEERGWLYTHKSIYPYFYDHSTKGWMYFQAGGDSPRYYHYNTKKWITFDSE